MSTGDVTIRRSYREDCTTDDCTNPWIDSMVEETLCVQNSLKNSNHAKKYGRETMNRNYTENAGVRVERLSAILYLLNWAPAVRENCDLFRLKNRETIHWARARFEKGAKHSTQSSARIAKKWKRWIFLGEKSNKTPSVYIHHCSIFWGEGVISLVRAIHDSRLSFM